MNRSHRCFIIFLSALAITAAGEESKYPAKRESGFDNRAFNPDVEKLPKQFSGMDSIGLFQAMAKNPEPKKEEFETMDQFFERHDKWSHRPVFAGLPLSTTIAFAFAPSDDIGNGVSFRYNADKSEMTMSLSGGLCERSGLYGMASRRKDLGSYVGQNAFGVKRTIAKAVFTQYCLTDVRDTTFTISMPRDRAVKEKYSAKVVFIGRVVPPYTETSTRYKSPTVDSPTEREVVTNILKFSLDDIWIMSGTTGDILYKHSRDQPKSD